MDELNEDKELVWDRLQNGILGQRLTETLSYRGDGRRHVFAINLGRFGWDRSEISINESPVTETIDYVIHNNAVHLTRPLPTSARIDIRLFRANTL